MQGSLDVLDNPLDTLENPQHPVYIYYYGPKYKDCLNTQI